MVTLGKSNEVKKIVVVKKEAKNIIIVKEEFAHLG
jgi:hypothetical protein